MAAEVALGLGIVLVVWNLVLALRLRAVRKQSQAQMRRIEELVEEVVELAESMLAQRPAAASPVPARVAARRAAPEPAAAGAVPAPVGPAAPAPLIPARTARSAALAEPLAEQEKAPLPLTYTVPVAVAAAAAMPPAPAPSAPAPVVSMAPPPAAQRLEAAAIPAEHAALPSVLTMAQAGMSEGAIAKALGISTAEVRLMLRLASLNKAN